ncbi:MAG: hypothetical protein RLZZ543_617, partial [Bacteroidota bacterium]
MYVYDVFGMLVCWLGNVLMVLCEIISISISKFSNLVLKRVEGQINYHQHTSTRSAQRNSTLKSAHQHTSTSAHSYLCAKACNSMSHHHHEEDHLKSSAFISDIVIGMADGLTVPFALAAGLSGAVHSNSVVITAGIAEIVAGSIAMGLGGYLAGKTEQEHYAAEWKREAEEVERIPER